MVTPLPRIVTSAALWTAITVALCAQTPDPIAPERGPVLRTVSLPVQPAASSTSQPSATTSESPVGCVLLKNDHVLFGQAQQLGELVVVRSIHGGEIRIDRQQVACWAPTLRDLYQYRVDHRRDGDLESHLRDARWCLRYELLDLAAAELRAVYAIDANHSEARRIQQKLNRRVAPQTPRPAFPDPVLPVRYDAESEDTQPKLFDGPTLSRFAGQIQPMLINRCGNCHSHRLAEADVTWRIFAPPTGTRASAEFTRTNLQATIPYIDPVDPLSSPLLVNATEEHGGHPPFLTRRNASAIDALRSWVALVAQESRMASEMGMEEGIDADEALDEQPPTVSDPPATTSQPPSKSKPDGPSRLPEVENPFDPDLFNRRFHMKTNGRP